MLNNVRRFITMAASRIADALVGMLGQNDLGYGRGQMIPLRLPVETQKRVGYSPRLPRR